MSTITKISSSALRAFCALTVIFLCFEFYYEFQLSDTRSPTVAPTPISASPPTELPNGPSIEEILDNVQQREGVIEAKEAKVHREELVIKQKEDLLQKAEEALRSRESAIAQALATVAPIPELIAAGLERKSLIQYAYFEAESARENLKFFLRHGFHDSADFIFIFNGATDADELLPNNPKSPWYDEKVSNIRVIKRDNTCYDLGAHTEVLMKLVDENGQFLTEEIPGENVKKRLLWYRYNRFILMNASVRGPFLPHWSALCWNEAFWDLITDKVKMVGMSYKCHEGQGHVESMVWALDRTGMATLLQPDPVGLGGYCPMSIEQATQGELRSTPAIRNAGFEVDVLTALYHSNDAPSSTEYNWGCGEEDSSHENAYRGFNVHPYETIFVKNAKHMQETLLANVTEWADGNEYSSYDACRIF